MMKFKILNLQIERGLDISAKILEPNEYGYQLCPYCFRTLVPILREWMNPPAVTDYICLHCQIGFEVRLKGGIEDFT